MDVEKRGARTGGRGIWIFVQKRGARTGGRGNWALEAYFGYAAWPQLPQRRASSWPSWASSWPSWPLLLALLGLILATLGRILPAGVHQKITTQATCPAHAKTPKNCRDKATVHAYIHTCCVKGFCFFGLFGLVLGIALQASSRGHCKRHQEALLGPLGASSWPSWASSWPSWASSSPSWPSSLPCWAFSWPSWASSWPSCASSWPSWRLLLAILSLTLALLRLLLAVLVPPFGHLEPHLGHLGPPLYGRNYLISCNVLL